MKTDTGAFYDCRIKGKFRIQGIKSTNPIAVGDRVRFELETVGDESVATIAEILPRKNYLVRKAVKLSKQTHIIAANIDQVFLLITLEDPRTLPVFIDRFLATAEAYDIPCIMLFNKIDAYGSAALEEWHYLRPSTAISATNVWAFRPNRAQGFSR